VRAIDLHGNKLHVECYPSGGDFILSENTLLEDNDGDTIPRVNRSVVFMCCAGVCSYVGNVSPVVGTESSSCSSFRFCIYRVRRCRFIEISFRV